MPTTTFFRLPEEKRKRLLDAAWEEITRVSFSDASINQIIHSAAISRGSFYQYFADKDDLLAYLFQTIRDHFAGRLNAILAELNGDLFRVPLLAFDQFIDHHGITDPALGRLIRVAQLNPGVDFQRLTCGNPRQLPRQVLSMVSTKNYRKTEVDFVGDVFFLCVTPLAYAVMESLRNPEQREQQREILSQRLDIIRRGTLTPGTEEALRNENSEH